jgi:hypothetical protein
MQFSHGACWFTRVFIEYDDPWSMELTDTDSSHLMPKTGDDDEHLYLGTLDADACLQNHSIIPRHR